jgi:methanogenic corrinoid protein MtbC1
MAVRAPYPEPPRAAELREALLLTLAAADQASAHGIVDRAARLGWSADELRCELITPALHEIGRRWERGEIGVADEHLASSVCEWLLFSIAGRARRAAASDRRAVVGCSAGELHALGALVVSNVLAEHGWRVLYLGASTPVDAWAPIVRARRADVAVISTTSQAVVAPVPETVRSIHEARPACLTVVGGQAYDGPRGVARAAGAGLVAHDPRELPARLDERLGAEG